MKEDDTLARLETQTTDAYKDAQHYSAKSPLSLCLEDETPVETDKPVLNITVCCWTMNSARRQMRCVSLWCMRIWCSTRNLFTTELWLIYVCALRLAESGTTHGDLRPRLILVMIESLIRSLINR